jgi:hypothetical protein
VNRLAGESSPYLRQHADNPVDWYPWGPEAMARAAAEDKPLFVSIGYASCHWCHVMAHESFDDPAVGADLSRWFVPVKVDREQRPDVDAVYMPAAIAMTGSGGWPLSVFCTPDGRPFFAGTYFPPTDRRGMPSFRRVLASLAEAWEDRRDEIEQQADALLEAIAAEASITDRFGAGQAASPGRVGTGAVPSLPDVLETAVAELSERFDPDDGGFGPAPKFPRPTLVELCLRHHRTTGAPASAAMAARTLDAMAAGGIYDHLAGGFARYSTDARWLVPHFEKMLTDQVLLARAYLHSWQETGNPDHRQVVDETLDYVVSDLSAPEGGLCSSEDADAGGVEGGHATFTVEQVRTALTEGGRPDLVEAAIDWYGVTEGGNWEGTNVLRRPLGGRLARPEPVEEARRLLLGFRRRRPSPARDDKVLTEWNAMAVATLAESAGATGNPRWAAAAVEVGEFLFERLRRPDGRWLRCLGAPTPAFCADYAWVVEACLRLSALTGAAVWIERAREIADRMTVLFVDGGSGGLFTVGDDGEHLVVRGKEWLDGALPSANSVAALALLRLGALTGDSRYRQIGERVVELAAPLLDRHPTAVADMVGALALVDAGPGGGGAGGGGAGGGAGGPGQAGVTEVVITGDRPDLLAVVSRRWLPDAVVAWGERWDSPLWEGRADGAAFVCRHAVCGVPATDPATLASQLDAGRAVPTGTVPAKED